jgi:hypothetical protein
MTDKNAATNEYKRIIRAAIKANNIVGLSIKARRIRDRKIFAIGRKTESGTKEFVWIKTDGAKLTVTHHHKGPFMILYKEFVFDIASPDQFAKLGELINESYVSTKWACPCSTSFSTFSVS